MALPVIHLDRESASAAFTGWSGEVANYSNLPSAASGPGQFWMVLNASGSRFLLNYKASGLYLSESGSWRKINNAQLLLNDAQFAVYNTLDNTKQIAFDVSAIATATKRTATWPNKDGTVAFTSDVVSSHNSLSGIQGGAVGDYQHLTTLELNDVQAIDQVFTLAEKTKLTGIEPLAEVNTINSIVAGTNISIDVSSPLNPIINSTGSAAASAIPIVSVTSTDTTSTFSQSVPLICSWDVERYKDSGFTHSNSTNNTRLTVDEDGTYQIAASIRVFEASEQRAQSVARILINGVIQAQPYGSSYIRNSGDSSDYWSCVINPPPLKLSANDYIEVQIQIESQTTSSWISVFQGDESSFSVIKLQGTTGATGATGAGANIIVQENGVTVGTVTSTLNFADGFSSVTDEGSNETKVTAEQQYTQTDSNAGGGTVNASYGTPLECTPSAGTFEVTVAETGNYLIYAKVGIGTNLNEDNGAIEIVYGVNGSITASAESYVQNQQAKKNKRNGIQGTFGNVALTAGDVVTVFISTLGDSTSWENGYLYLTTWK
jgi:hypothetical protein